MLDSNVIAVSQYPFSGFVIFSHGYIPYLSHRDGWEDLQLPGGTEHFKDIRRNLSKPKRNNITQEKTAVMELLWTFDIL